MDTFIRTKFYTIQKNNFTNSKYYPLTTSKLAQVTVAHNFFKENLFNMKTRITFFNKTIFCTLFSVQLFFGGFAQTTACDFPIFMENQNRNYAVGDVISRNSIDYQVKVAPWANSSISDWAYAPETGTNWQLAWDVLNNPCISSTDDSNETDSDSDGIVSSGSEENCQDGMDNDNDGLIDNFDPDCACQSKDKYFWEPTDDAECGVNCSNPQYDSLKFSAPTNFTLPVFQNSVINWHPYNTPITADTDGDGIPNIIGKGHNINFTLESSNLPSNLGFQTPSQFLVILNGDNQNPIAVPTPDMAFIFDAVAVANLDTVGLPEILMLADGNKQGILSPNNAYQFPGSVIGTVSDPGINWSIPMDVRGHIICYVFDPNDPSPGYKVKWVSDQPGVHNPNHQDNSTSHGFESSVDPEIVDFNHDGIPEIYLQNRIFSFDGKFLASGLSSESKGRINNALGTSKAFSVAGDVINKIGSNKFNNLELICGNTVYSVNDQNLVHPSRRNNPGVVYNASLQVSSQLEGVVNNPNDNQVYERYPDGWTSLADMDGDKMLDVVVSSQNTTSLVIRNNLNPRAFRKSFLYVWNPRTETVIGEYYPPNAMIQADRGAMSQPNVGDFDGDGFPEIGICIEEHYAVLDWDTTVNSNGVGFTNNNLEVLWKTNFPNSTALGWRRTNDESGETGTTVFDFNGDGKQEIVYRDQDSLYIINGETGQNISNSIACYSWTSAEYPVIVDVDKDGQTEVLVSCGNNVSMFKAEQGSQPWQSTRSVWNQHNYFNVNINDDLSIPRFQQRHDLVGNVQNTSVDRENIMNNFLVQIPTFKYSDVNIKPVSQECDNENSLFTFEICNSGNNHFPIGAPITFYDGNPDSLNVNVLRTIITNVQINAQTCENIQVDFPFKNGKEIFVMVNDLGINPTPWSGSFQPNSNVSECDYTDNLNYFTPNCSENVTIKVQRKNCDKCEDFVLEVNIKSEDELTTKSELFQVNSCAYEFEISLKPTDEVILSNDNLSYKKVFEDVYIDGEVMYLDNKDYFDFSDFGEENYQNIEFTIDNSENCQCEDKKYFLYKDGIIGNGKTIQLIDCEGTISLCVGSGDNYDLFSESAKGTLEKEMANVILNGSVQYNNEGYMKTEPLDPAKCCESLENLSEESLLVFSENQTITVNTIWDNKVFIKENVILTIDGAGLDVTNVDVIFGECSGIDFINNATLRSTNSVFRPCDIAGVWRGLKFDVDSDSPFLGFMNTSTIKNAVYGIQANGLNNDSFNLRITDNTFINCFHSIDLNRVNLLTSITGNTFNKNEFFPIFYDQRMNFSCNNHVFNTAVKHAGAINAFATEFNGKIANNTFIRTNDGSSTFGAYPGQLERYFGIILAVSSNPQILNNNDIFNAFIVNNTFTNLQNALRVRGKEVTFSGNTISNTEFNGTNSSNDLVYPIFLENASNIEIENNHLDFSGFLDANANGGNGVPAISANSSDLLNVNNNEINGYQMGISLKDVENSNVNSNEIHQYSKYGIYVENCFNNLIISCNELNGNLRSGEIQTVGIGDFVTTRGNQVVTNVIKGNCILDNSTALHIQGNGNSGNHIAPQIFNNFIFNYNRFGIQNIGRNLHKRVGSGNAAPNRGKNSFNSNNEGTAFDVASNTQARIYWNWGANNTNPMISRSGRNKSQSSASCAAHLKTDRNSTMNLNEYCVLGVQTRSYQPQTYDYSIEINRDDIRQAEIMSFEKSVIQEDLFRFYPNPVKNELFVDVLKDSENLSIDIKGVNGNLIKYYNNVSNFENLSINVSDLSPGIYFINLNSETGTIQSKKFIKIN